MRRTFPYLPIRMKYYLLDKSCNIDEIVPISIGGAKSRKKYYKVYAIDLLKHQCATIWNAINELIRLRNKIEQDPSPLLTHIISDLVP